MIHALFLAALLLWPGVALAAVDAVAPGAPATVWTCFAPEQDCAAVAVRAINHARAQVLVNAYNLTTGPGIVEALLAAKARGVDVRLIADKTSPCERNAGVAPLFEAGVPIWIDRVVRIAHAKVLIIDDRIVVAGSYNWSAGAAKNSEDLNVFDAKAIAAAYTAHWQQRLAVSFEYKNRGDWCKS